VLTQAQRAKIETEEAALQEQIQFNYVDAIAKEGWNGMTATGFESGTGTEEDPYIINSESQFAYLSREVMNGNYFDGKYIKLNCNLNFNNIQFRGISSDGNLASSFDKGFNGTFDGNGKVIVKYKNKQNISSLFYVLEKDGVIKNLNIFDSTYVSNSGAIGAIVGYNYGTIENCINYSNIKSESSIGGICYLNSAGTIRSSYNYGNIESVLGLCGGICAFSGAIGVFSDNGEESICFLIGGKFENCINYGNIKSLRNSAGILTIDNSLSYEESVALFPDTDWSTYKTIIPSEEGELIIRNCCNYGSICGDDTDNGDSYGVGGIFVCANNNSGTNVTIDGCQNFGNVSGTKFCGVRRNRRLSKQSFNSH